MIPITKEKKKHFLLHLRREIFALKTNTKYKNLKSKIKMIKDLEIWSNKIQTQHSEPHIKDKGGETKQQRTEESFEIWSFPLFIFLVNKEIWWLSGDKKLKSDMEKKKLKNYWK